MKKVFYSIFGLVIPMIIMFIAAFIAVHSIAGILRDRPIEVDTIVAVANDGCLIAQSNHYGIDRLYRLESLPRQVDVEPSFSRTTGLVVTNNQLVEQHDEQGVNGLLYRQGSTALGLLINSDQALEYYKPRSRNLSFPDET